MIDQTRISRGEQPSQSLVTRQQEQAKGSWNGMAVELRQVKDVDSQIRRAEYRRNNGLEAATDRKTLNERSVNLDLPSLSVTPNTLGKLAKAFGGEPASTKLAQKYLQHFRGQPEKPRQDNSLSSLMQHYVALHKLSAALKESDGDFVARLTPQSEGSNSLEELAKKLIDAGDDPVKMGEVLAEVDGFEEESDQLHALMKTLRFNPDQLKNKLRDTQQLPELSSEEKKALLEKVEDALLQMEIDDGSRIKAARNGIEKGFETDDPENFVESYSDALEHTGSFIQTLTTLVKRHTPAELRHVIPLMKQTLADELQLGQDERSTDKIKLECLLSELSFMHISTTLLEKINRLISGMQRIYG